MPSLSVKWVAQVPQPQYLKSSLIEKPPSFSTGLSSSARYSQIWGMSMAMSSACSSVSANLRKQRGHTCKIISLYKILFYTQIIMQLFGNNCIVYVWKQDAGEEQSHNSSPTKDTCNERKQCIESYLTETICSASYLKNAQEKVFRSSLKFLE